MKHTAARADSRAARCLLQQLCLEATLKPGHRSALSQLLAAASLTRMSGKNEKTEIFCLPLARDRTELQERHLPTSEFLQRHR